MDKEREAFEAWFVKTHNILPTRDKDEYQFPITQAVWEGWQARAKQTITLPVKDATGEH